MWRGYLFLALYRAAATQLTRMNALALGSAALLLALPMTAALWHQASVARLASLHQFQPGRGLHSWRSRRALGLLLRALGAVVLSAASLLQSAFFGPAEWLLLALAPALYPLLRSAVDRLGERQFSAAVYAQRWSFRATQWLLAGGLAAAWVATRWWLAEPAALPYAERVHALQ